MKYLGIFMIIIGVLLIPLFLFDIINVIFNLFKAKTESTEYFIGYILGIIIVLMFFSWIIYLLIKHGFRLKNKNKIVIKEGIDDIGKS
jgi:uncharacterized membrane protein YdjX (TVP38/TMEM64 family)